MSNIHILTVMDADTNYEYKFRLSIEDYTRAINDVTYCTQLLEGAKTTTLMNNVAENEVAGIADRVIQSIDNCNMQIDSEAIDEIASDEQNDGFRWADGAIRLLLATFKERERLLNNGHMSVKKFWEQISVRLEEKGYTITGPQCKSKLNGLKKTSKSVKDHNRKSGNSRRPWPYLEIMDDIFGNKPWVSPTHTLDSSASCSNSDASSSSTSSSGTATPEGRKSAKRQKVVHESSALLKVVETMVETREDRRKMHEDAMARQDRLLAILEKIADKKN